MVIKDTFRNKILWYKFVRNETIADYMEGIAWLCIHGIVCDGMRRFVYGIISLSCLDVPVSSDDDCLQIFDQSPGAANRTRTDRFDQENYLSI